MPKTRFSELTGNQKESLRFYLKDTPFNDLLRDTSVSPEYFHALVCAVINPNIEPRLRKVFVRRVNLGGKGFHTLKEIGDEIGVGKEQVRQVFARAVRKIKANLK